MIFSPVTGAHRLGSFLHAHTPHWHRRVDAPHYALAAGYMSTVVFASPVGYTLMTVAYTFALVVDVRRHRRVKHDHVSLAVAYLVTVVLYPAGITVVGAAYAFSMLTPHQDD